VAEVDEGHVAAADERAYVRSLDAAVEEPGGEIARVTCRHCNGRRVIGTVHLNGTALLWLSHDWAPVADLLTDDEGGPSIRTTKLLQVLLSVPADERPVAIRQPEGYCSRHGRILVDETQIPKQLRAGRRAPHIPM